MNANRKIFVFGSNSEGIHNAGAAYFAKKRHGAIQGQPMGLQGDSWAIVTKILRNGKRSVTLESIYLQVIALKEFALPLPLWAFTVTPIGCGLAGFKPHEIAPMFRHAPDNMLLPPEFKRILN